MKKLYYVVDKELQGFDWIEETTGNKTITVYTIENNDLKTVCIIEAQNEDNSVEEIQNYLNEINFGNDDDLLELILL